LKQEKKGTSCSIRKGGDVCLSGGEIHNGNKEGKIILQAYVREGELITRRGKNEREGPQRRTTELEPARKAENGQSQKNTPAKKIKKLMKGKGKKIGTNVKVGLPMTTKDGGKHERGGDQTQMKKPLSPVWEEGVGKRRCLPQQKNTGGTKKPQEEPSSANSTWVKEKRKKNQIQLEEEKQTVGKKGKFPTPRRRERINSQRGQQFLGEK